MIVATGRVWIWRAANPDVLAAWHFLTIDAQTAAEIRYAALGRSNRFGSIKVVATIGDTRWSTSLFPNKDTGGFLLPLKADVRKREGLSAGDEVQATLRV